MLIFWLFSTFFYFLKIYKFSKFTATTQRFWRRVFNIFWIVEFFWFIVFIFCLFTANHEPVHYEEDFIYKSLYLGNFEIFGYFVFCIVPVIVLLYFFSISTKYISYLQLIVLFIFISIFIFSFFFIELYQFFNLVTFFGEAIFSFNYNDNFFDVSIEFHRFRPRFAFFCLVLMAKFWHCIFIIFGFFYFILRLVETKKFSIYFFSLNYQNLIILYLMTFVQIISWFKWYFKLVWKKMWFWFFLNPGNYVWIVFFYSCSLYFNCFFYFIYKFFLFFFNFFNYKNIILNIFYINNSNYILNTSFFFDNVIYNLF